MSLLTDPDWLVRQLRIEFLRTEDPLAERILTFPDKRRSVVEHQQSQEASNEQHQQQQSIYVDDRVPEQGLCYSPNIHWLASGSLVGTSVGATLGGSTLSVATGSNADVSFQSSTRKLPPFQAGGRRQQAPVPQQPVTQPPVIHPTVQPPKDNGVSSTEVPPALPPITEPPLPVAPLVFPKETLSLLPHTRAFVAGYHAIEEVAKNKNNTTPAMPQMAPPKWTSSLTQSLAQQREQAHANPFTKQYSFVCGKGDRNPISLQIFVPPALEPLHPLQLLAKRDASVEEVIGYALYLFVEEKRKPLFSQWPSALQKVAAWNMRIVEEDGSIDGDFPVWMAVPVALERSRKISKFAFEQFALCPADNLPLSLNMPAHASLANKKIIVKVHTFSDVDLPHTSKVALRKDMTMAEAFGNCCKKAKVEQPEEFTMKMMDGTTDMPLDQTVESLKITELYLVHRKLNVADILRRQVHSDNMILLKVHLWSTLQVKQATMVQFNKNTPMTKVLEICCKKAKVDNPQDFTLTMVDIVTEIALNQTLEEAGIKELCLLKKTIGANRGDMFLQPPEESVDTTGEDAPGPAPTYIAEDGSDYRKYSVTRRAAMNMGKPPERSLVIDGDYIYIMHADNHRTADYVKPIPFHASVILSCTQIRETAGFRLVCKREKDVKTYEFDAVSPREAGEICTNITFLSQMHKGKQ